jgi:hypothetical protein
MYMQQSLAEKLNHENYRESLDRKLLSEETARWLVRDEGMLPNTYLEALFASVPVFLAPEQIRQMVEAVHAVEAMTRSDAYRQRVMAAAPQIAKHENRAKSVLFGYDFHLDETGPKLIEVNTNAGGALLNLLLGKAQRFELKDEARVVVPATSFDGLEMRVLEMFLSDWSLARGNAPLRTIVIVDDEPREQFLYVEFLLFRQLFRSKGYDAIIAAPEALTYENGALWCEGKRIDLVYNRLVDFYLEAPNHQALRDAYLNDDVVLTPHPQAHALFADKRNLVLLRDPELLAGLASSPKDPSVLLARVPETRFVTKGEAESFWRERKQWFFKPIHGYGSKAVYRGDKLTKATFAEILERRYIAQRIVPPSERRLLVDGAVVGLKFDVRCFVYDGRVELLAARLYQGQTTNFRTLGGGFAAVYSAD